MSRRSHLGHGGCCGGQGQTGERSLKGGKRNETRDKNGHAGLTPGQNGRWKRRKQKSVKALQINPAPLTLCPVGPDALYTKKTLLARQ